MGIHQPVITLSSGLLIAGVLLLLIIAGVIGYKLWRLSKAKAIAKANSAEIGIYSNSYTNEVQASSLNPILV